MWSASGRQYTGEYVSLTVVSPLSRSRVHVTHVTLYMLHGEYDSRMIVVSSKCLRGSGSDQGVQSIFGNLRRLFRWAFGTVFFFAFGFFVEDFVF